MDYMYEEKPKEKGGKWSYNYRSAGATATGVFFLHNGIHPIHATPENLEVILIKRSDDSDAFPGAVALPGGFLDVGKETIEECFIREVKEELNFGITQSDIHLFTVTSNPNDDARVHVVNTCYMVCLPTGLKDMFKAGDDAVELKILKAMDVHLATKNNEINWAFNHKDIFYSALSHFFRYRSIMFSLDDTYGNEIYAFN